MMTVEQERETIRQARTNARAFAPLYDHYYPRVHAYVCYRVFDPQDAEDVIADIFFKATFPNRMYRGYIPLVLFYVDMAMFH